MLHKDELVIRISENGEIYVEDINNGVKGYKKVNPSVFLDCIRNSIKVGAVSSGVLPEGTISYSAGEYGMKRICLVFPERRCDISYKKTKYENFPLPRLVLYSLSHCVRSVTRNTRLSQEKDVFARQSSQSLKKFLL